MTPWQVHCHVRGFFNGVEREYKTACFMMWHNAVLSRPGQKVPPLSSFTKPPKRSNVIDEESIKARLMAHNRKVQEDGNSSETSGGS
jgi:hypothetical protein